MDSGQGYLMAVSDSLRCCCVGGYPVVIGSLARPETGNWR
ncbi:hypothetical protein SeW_A3135 [Salmonella enterica subsp. enterica serovar Weltevreden str. HI_N05-537]|nr:hypothetical protein SeW_A3135 [Salmonella enterica subsp. enterica serovar Weltevreden str. HI_N05-537]